VPAGQVSFSAACKRSHAEKQHQPYVALRRPKKITNFWSAPRALNESAARRSIEASTETLSACRSMFC